MSPVGLESVAQPGPSLVGEQPTWKTKMRKSEENLMKIENYTGK